MPDETEPDAPEPDETAPDEIAPDQHAAGASEAELSDANDTDVKRPSLPPPTGERAEDDEPHRRRARAKAPGRVAAWRQRFTWRRAIVWGWIAVFAFLFVRWVYPHNVDEGFIRFQPDASLFPAAPVDGAETLVGIGTPDSWTDGPDYCPYSQFLDPSYGFRTARGRAWHTVRHDWEEDGEAKAWVVSERTMAFGNPEEGEKFIDGLRERFTYCGWEYDTRGPGGVYNTIITDLDGLPDDSFAFVVDASPTSDEIPATFGFSDPDDFDGLGVVMPGRKAGHMVFVTWTGWATGVPRDEFVATANRIYEAANEAPNPDDAFKKDDATIEFQGRFEEFDPDESSVASLLDEPGGSDPIALNSRECDLDWRDAKRGYLPDDQGWPLDTYAVKNEERRVEFTSDRFEERWRYLAAKDRMSQVVTPLCLGTLQHPEVLIEPVAVPAGLPEGTTAAVWYSEPDGGTHAFVLTDDERQLIMVITWTEFDGDPPARLLVDVINTAWTEFHAANP